MAATNLPKSLWPLSFRKRNSCLIIVAFILISFLPFALVSCSKEDSISAPDPVVPQQVPFKWTSAPPSEHGFDPVILDTLTERISSRALGRISSLLIVRNGHLVYEEYFRGNDRYDLVKVYSCTKSVASALVGIAIGEGAVSGVDDRLFDYLDGYVLFPDNRHDSAYRENLTLEHLLTMTAGFSWDELEFPYGHPENSYTQMVGSNDWIQFTLNQQITSEPGSSFAYNTGLSGIMAVIIENSTGQRVDTYAREKLFEHIGIDTCIWRMTPSDVPMTGSGLELRPRDMAKFGWLYAQNGVWDGDTIVPSSWVQSCIQPFSTLPDGRGYGYQWWLLPITDDDNQPLTIPYALGYGDQHIFFVSSYDLVIVITAENFQSQPYTYILEILELIGDALVS